MAADAPRRGGGGEGVRTRRGAGGTREDEGLRHDVVDTRATLCGRGGGRVCVAHAAGNSVDGGSAGDRSPDDRR